MNDKKIIKLVFTALTPIFIPCLGLEKLRQSRDSRPYKVVQYTRHRAKIIKHIGSAKDDFERDLLITKAQEWIEKYTLQSNLFPESKQNVLIVTSQETNPSLHLFYFH